MKKLTPAVQMVFEVTAATFQTVTAEEIRERDRHKSVVNARHVVMWVLVKHLGMSRPEAGRQFIGYRKRNGVYEVNEGGKDHSSVCAGVNKVQRSAELQLMAVRVVESLAKVRKVSEHGLPFIDLPEAVGAE